MKAAAAPKAQKGEAHSVMPVLTVQSQAALHLADAQEVHVGRLVRQQQGEGVPAPAHTGSPANSVHKDIWVLRWIKLHYPGHIWDVQAPCCHVCAQQDACMPEQTSHPV